MRATSVLPAPRAYGSNKYDHLLDPPDPEAENAAPAGPRNGAYQKTVRAEIYHNRENLPAESGLDLPLNLSIFANVGARKIESKLLTLRELADFIKRASAPAKADLQLLKLAAFGDHATPKGSLRHDANLKTIQGIEADYDAGAVTPAEAAALLRNHDLAALIYTTPSHTPDSPRWRVLVPTLAPMAPAERDGLCERLNGALGGILAREFFARSQAYYYGSVQGAEPLTALLVEGRPIDTATEIEGIAKSDPPKAQVGTDKTRSGRALKIAGECRRQGLDFNGFRGELAKDPETDAWAKEKGPRQVIRAWEHTATKSIDPDSAFDDLPELIDGYPMTEDGVALAFAARHADRLRFCHSTGRWFNWTGTHWRREETHLAFEWAREICRERAATDPLAAQAKALAKAASASAVERFARSDRAFAVNADAWDGDCWLLGTPGGTVDLRTGDVRLANPRDMITKVTAAAPIPLDRFDPAQGCPRWIAFLQQATDGDADAIRFLQQWAGYSLTGDTREEALLFVHGPGGSGKSTAINTLAALLGDYAVNVPTETLTAAKHDRHSTEIARLMGARMAFASETEQGRAWAENRIKQLTGGDVMTARFMRQDDFSFKPQLKLTIVGNNRPSFENVDGAIRRRFNVMPFDQIPETPDNGLKAALEAEFSGILSWAMLGCLDWQRDGLVRPLVVLATTSDYFEEQDTFAAWIKERCEVGKGFAATTESLFDSWSYYARFSASEEPGSKTKTFPDRLKQHGYSPIRDSGGIRGRGFKGLRVQEMPLGGDGDDL